MSPGPILGDSAALERSVPVYLQALSVAGRLPARLNAGRAVQLRAAPLECAHHALHHLLEEHVRYLHRNDH